MKIDKIYKTQDAYYVQYKLHKTLDKRKLLTSEVKLLRVADDRYKVEVNFFNTSGATMKQFLNERFYLEREVNKVVNLWV